jgi:ABC-type sugar transport system permease subunit
MPYAVPGAVSAVIWRWIYDPTYGVLNAVLWRLGLIEHYIPWTGLPHLAMPSLIFAYVWKFVPYSAFLLLAGLMTIPQSIYEAAAIDGASRGVILRRITLPMMWPVIQFVLVFQTIFAMTMHFGLVYVLTGGGPGDRTTTLAWYTYVETFSFLYFGRGAALAILQALLMAGFIYLYLVVLAPGRRGAEAT